MRRGYDPRDFTLVAAGGAGPLFACDIALELEIPRVLVPPHPGIIAATGLLATDLQHEFVATERHALKTLDQQRLADALRRARRREAVAQLDARRRAGGPAARARASPTAATRARATRFASTCPAGAIDDAWVEAADGGLPRARTRREYGHRFDADVEIVNVRVVGIGRIEELELAAAARPATAIRRGALTMEREVVFDVDGGAERALDAVLRPRPAARGRSDRRARRSSSSTTRPPSSRRGSTAEIDRCGNIVIDCTSRGARGRRAATLATPILMRVIGGAFSAIAKEMAGVLFRMSYSSIIRESEDLGAGIFDADGNELAESDSTPMFMGAMPKIVKGVIRLLGDDIHDGDVILHNDPYLGRHALARRRDRRSRSSTTASSSASPAPRRTCSTSAARSPAWPSTSSTTGPRATSTARSSSPSKGVRQDALWKHILENTRTPTYNRGDIEAMIAACELAKRATSSCSAATARRRVLGAARDWIDYSERMLRQEIAKVPDGVYETDVGWLDDDGAQPRRAAAGEGRRS